MSVTCRTARFTISKSFGYFGCDGSLIFHALAPIAVLPERTVARGLPPRAAGPYARRRLARNALPVDTLCRDSRLAQIPATTRVSRSRLEAGGVGRLDVHLDHL